MDQLERLCKDPYGNNVPLQHWCWCRVMRRSCATPHLLQQISGHPQPPPPRIRNCRALRDQRNQHRTLAMPCWDRAGHDFQSHKSACKIFMPTPRGSRGPFKPDLFVR